MKAELKASLKEAMKAKDKIKLDTIRAILSAIQYEEMQKGVEEISSADTTAILQREIKKREETIELSEKAGRDDMVTSSREEIALIQALLPKQLSAGEIETILTDLKIKDPTLNLGGAMKILKDSYAGQYDGKTASEAAKRVLG